MLGVQPPCKTQMPCRTSRLAHTCAKCYNFALKEGGESVSIETHFVMKCERDCRSNTTPSTTLYLQQHARLMRESGVGFRGGMLHEPPENGGEEQVLAGEGGVSEGSSITAEKWL